MVIMPSQRIRTYIDSQRGFKTVATLKSEEARLFQNSDLFDEPVEKIVQILLNKYKRNTARTTYHVIKKFLVNRAAEFAEFERANPRALSGEYIGRTYDVSDDNIKALLLTIPGDIKNFVVLAAFGGLRLAEALNLQWKDVDFKNNKIYVRQGKGRKDRVVHVAPKYLKMLKRIFSSSSYVVNSSESTIRRTLGSTLTPHALRSFAITKWVNAGISLFAVGNMAGHNSMNTTKKYVQITDDDLRKLANA